MPYFLAIDAGGTSTRCVLADADRILARATTGSVKLMRVPEVEATARLHAMLDEVSEAGGVGLSDVVRTCFGLAGLTIPAVRAWAEKAVTERVAGKLILCGDEEIALDAAFRGGPGVLVIAGTGSNVIGRTVGGELVGAGGWGPVLGDEGSGYWIGLEAIRAALRAQDHAATRLDAAAHSTHLLAEIELAWGLESLPELIALGNHRGDATRVAPDFSSLAPVVAGQAEHGNALAASILNRAGEGLAAQVVHVARKIAAASGSNGELRAVSLEIAFTGSVLSQIATVRAAMVSSLAQTLPGARVQAAAVDPLEGALYRARQG
jgi:glucosamine kinase